MRGSGHHHRCEPAGCPIGTAFGIFAYRTYVHGAVEQLARARQPDAAMLARHGGVSRIAGWIGGTTHAIVAIVLLAIVISLMRAGPPPPPQWRIAANGTALASPARRPYHPEDRMVAGMDDTTQTPIERPDLIVPDTGPLIHLAQADALFLLHAIGGRVVITDMVAAEATMLADKPGALAIRDWIEAGTAPGSNAPVLVEPTDVGRAFRTARLADPGFRWRGAGELSILEWLRDAVDGTDRATLVVYENGRVPRLIGDYGLEANIDILTTRAFLRLAQRRGIVADAEPYWARIAAAAPTASPNDVVTMHRKG